MALGLKHPTTKLQHAQSGPMHQPKPTGLPLQTMCGSLKKADVQGMYIAQRQDCMGSQPPLGNPVESLDDHGLGPKLVADIQPTLTRGNGQIRFTNALHVLWQMRRKCKLLYIPGGSLPPRHVPHNLSSPV